MTKTLTPQAVAKLYDYVQRSEGSAAELAELMELSADFEAYNEALPACTEAFIEDYGKYRSRGFTFDETAYLLGVSPTVLHGMMLGKFVDKREHRKLVECEATAKLALENKLLDVVLSSAEQVPTMAVKALEMLYPEKYRSAGARVTINAAVETPEQKAVRAQEELRQARALREPIDI